MRKRRLVVVTFFTAVVLQGCLIEITRYSGSGAASSEKPHRIKAGDTAVLNYPNLKATVQLQDLRRTWTQFGWILPIIPIPGGSKPYPPLRIWIDLEPEDDSFEFEPGKVTLEDGRGQTLSPVGYWGPGMGSRRPGFAHDARLACGVPDPSNRIPVSSRYRRPIYRRFRYEECYNCRHKSTSSIKNPTGSIPLHGPTCFVLLYDATPSSEGELVVSLGGLKHGRSLLLAQQARFEKASAWDGRFMP